MKIIFLLHGAQTGQRGLANFINTDYVPELARAFPYLSVERCNFLNEGGMVTVGHVPDAPPPPGYGAILEARIAGADLARFQQDLREPGTAGRWDEIAGGHLNNRLTQRIAVDERTTPPSDIGQSAAVADDGTMVKQIVNLRKKPGMSHADFVDYYENKHAPLTVRTLPIFSKYVRNFVIDDGELQRSLNPEGGAIPDFDVATHIWFKDEAARQKFAAAFDDPETGAMFAADSDRLFEPGSMQMFLVDERVLSTV